MCRSEVVGVAAVIVMLERAVTAADSDHAQKGLCAMLAPKAQRLTAGITWQGRFC